MAKILLVDDDTTFCLMLKTWLTKRGFEVENAFSCREALAKLKGTKYDVVLTDLRLPDEDGIYLLKNIKASTPEVQVILMTGYADIQTAVLAMKLGAFDYVAKPVIPDEILKKIQDTLEQTAVPEQKKRTKKPQSVPYIKGTSLEADKLYEYIRLVAPTMMTVLITGESGVGKESFPQIIHQYSRRKHGQYIAVNCGAIPEGTIDSELFGHEKGAFTGAIGERKGYFGEADGGTIFLDEVGELPMPTQARLLRVLESGEFIKVGSSRVQKTDVRIVAATNVNLTQAIAEGRFREDLYYRLNTVPIQIPPLRERGDDVLLLFRKFAADFAEKYRMPAIQLTEDAKKELLAYPWPGNVRQLKNITEQISIIETNREINAAILQTYLPAQNTQRLPALLGTRESKGFESEREILYSVLFDMRQEVAELKKMVHNLMAERAGQVSPVSAVVATPVVTAQPSVPAIIHPVQQPAVCKDDDDIQDTEEYVEESLSLDEVEKEMICKALERHHGKRKSAAKDLNISERTLYRKIKEYDLD